MKKLDTSTFVVLGEGLAAGMVNFSLHQDDQKSCFAAQLAPKIGAAFPQPLIQPPGIGDAHGFPRLPVRLPMDQQTTVLCEFPPVTPISNVSIPGLTLAEALARRPATPLIHRGDARQTAINFILGMPGLLNGGARPTQLEYALQRKPTFAIVALGFSEVLEAATSGNPAAIPDAPAFRTRYSQLLSSLIGANSEVLVTTIPDPMDTAYFSSIEAVSRVTKLPASSVEQRYNVSGNDRVTVDGLTEIGYHVMARRTGPLPKGSTLNGKLASEVSNRVKALNNEITSLANEKGATVYDLNGLFRRVREQGVSVGSRRLTSDLLGGFYSLNGYYPGKTGHALIANEIIEVLNRTYGQNFTAVDAQKLIESDPVASYRPSEGPLYETFGGQMAAFGSKMKFLATMGGLVGKAIVGGLRRKHDPVPPEGGSDPSRWTLKLPPGLEQELPINKEASYYGDALRAVHTADAAEAFFGLTGQLLFGGLAMLDSHLRGRVKIKFSPPANNVTHFEVSHPSGLKGDDERLSAPQFFKLPAIDQQVLDSFDSVSSGDLNLITGEVTNLQYKLFFLNSAILSLAAVNPSLPRDPLQFPGQYGSTWARFDNRADGKLDYTSYATTFIPLSVLGVPVRFPLPFLSPSGDFASIPCDGTALHPHIHISTRPPEGPDPGVEVPEIPTNTIREFVASIHNNSFGDDFSLNAPDLGGPAKGRSHLVGRFQIQFGERFGDAVPIAVMAMPPGGQLCTLKQSPFAEAFKSRIPDGLQGHNERLKFPNQIYDMDTVSYLDDPLDIALGAVNLKTGKLIGRLLRRGLITTSWLLAMVRLETRTPKATFAFRGDASLEKGVHGQTVFRYNGKLHIPFPEGFLFPRSDLTNTITIGPDSALDPFVRWQAMAVPDSMTVAKSGSASRIQASSGEEFSYSYSIPSGDTPASFEYENHTKGGTFRMQCLTWVGLINSKTSACSMGDCDTVTFSGLGTWSKDPTGAPHVAAVQVSTSARFPYVSILIDGGSTSNANTKPANVDDTMP
jgi:hypothetical protein